MSPFLLFFISGLFANDAVEKVSFVLSNEEILFERHEDLEKSLLKRYEAVKEELPNLVYQKYLIVNPEIRISEYSMRVNSVHFPKMTPIFRSFGLLAISYGKFPMRGEADLIKLGFLDEDLELLEKVFDKGYRDQQIEKIYQECLGVSDDFMEKDLEKSYKNLKEFKEKFYYYSSMQSNARLFADISYFSRFFTRLQFHSKNALLAMLYDMNLTGISWAIDIKQFPIPDESFIEWIKILEAKMHVEPY